MSDEYEDMDALTLIGRRFINFYSSHVSPQALVYLREFSLTYGFVWYKALCAFVEN